MNNFAGIISSRPDADAGSYLQRLQHLFPTRSAAMRPVSLPRTQALGNFEPSALDADGLGGTLFLDGEIFNREEIVRGINATEREGQNNATLLHALIRKHGINALARVNGQFLVIYADAAANTIHLISDHSGVQQVFYHKGQDFFIFASDIKFLLAHPECPSEIDWESSLRRPYPHTVLSAFRSYTPWFKHISLLPEATDCSINYRENTVEQRRFWNGLYDYAPASPDDKRHAADVMDEYMALLDDAVKIRIRGSEKAYSFLSGGLDSSAICALAAKHKPLDSFSIINQTTVIEDTTSVCSQLGKDLQFTNTQFLIPYHELTFNKQRWKQRIWRTESPVNHTDALTKNLLHYAIGHHDPAVPYVLTGTGSDQYNGGLVRWISSEEDGPQGFFDKVKEGELRQFVSRDDEGLWRVRKLLHPDYIADIAGGKRGENYWMYYAQSALHGETYSLLWDELRAASAHSRSVRFPFLDYRFAQFMASVPAHLHKELFYDKQILRTPSGKILPEYVTSKSKVPAFIPGYDFRPRLFDFLTSGEDSLLEQAFGDRDTPHAVIDKKQLWSRVEALKQNPEPVEWQELMHIINLGLLEQLAGKGEAALDFEKDMDVPATILFENPVETKAALQSRLSVRTEEQLLALPLLFEKGCALMRDYKTGNFFLAKNNTLAYEIDEQYGAWLALLQSIDGAQSTAEILQSKGESFESIREFFMLALKEQILTLGTTVPVSKTEAEPCPE